MGRNATHKCIGLAILLFRLPLATGSEPGPCPHVPEPMIYDLVRNLCASRGEIEINALTEYSPNEGTVTPSPEIEYSFLDGYAVELEVDTNIPVDPGHLEGNMRIADYKPSLQGTFGYHNSHFAHGWQFTGEYFTDGKGFSNTAIYLLEYQFNKHWSIFSMAGARRSDFFSNVFYKGIVNQNLFYTFSSGLILGLEVNWVYKPNFPSNSDNLIVMPEVHKELTEHINLQFGVGLERTKHKDSLNTGMRLVYTF
ncbi:hypothetical protein [Candidatus Nitrosacidococcus sp. I8]|uniref:hypothetical protein n=1 Tax=Candidatus Nitrosacidococcus sp. I8 TaxID=2942908 RepID=UPI0022271CC3|nr:hypothetical protein [Candidatus Nitrosacidococcus sp. I8]CAH9018861.1 hypothetical protein NURINAE_01183 [Candidatus Nitrosacidococcus sp. I8]